LFGDEYDEYYPIEHLILIASGNTLFMFSALQKSLLYQSFSVQLLIS